MFRKEEIELTRHNVTPAQFAAYVRQALKKKGFNGICAEDIVTRTWAAGGDIEFDIDNRKIGPEHSGCEFEKSVSRPYQSQTYVKNWDGTVYNCIMEFEKKKKKTGFGYFYYINVYEVPEEKTVDDVVSMAAEHVDVKIVCEDGFSLGSMSDATAREMYGSRKVKNYVYEYDKVWNCYDLLITLTDDWHRDGSPEILEQIDNFGVLDDGAYMVRCYNRRGDLARTFYTMTEDDAAEIRTTWAASIGVFPGDREHWALFPTVWKKDAAGEFHRMTKYA